MIAAVGVVVFAVCVFFAKRLTKRIVAPIEKLASNITLVDEGEVYEEMQPFVATIKQQHIDILNHAKLRQEFTANVSHELNAADSNFRLCGADRERDDERDGYKALCR